MYFLNNSGHIFQLPDYNQNPIGYEYDEQDYIFWFENIIGSNHLSVNNYYVKTINVLYEIDSNIQDFDNIKISDFYSIDIECESNIFKLIRPIDIHNGLSKNKTIFDYIPLNEQHSKLSSDTDSDFIVMKITNDNKNYIMIPIYVICKSQYEGTWISNILISIKQIFSNNTVWCPISIGGIFIEQNEQLVINTNNTGVYLPKDILTAVYETSIYDKNFNEELYNRKIKEYLLNKVVIKDEIGNYRSAISSLKWFGWGSTLELYKLLETDNEFKHQYIRDYFNINTDIIFAYNQFITTEYIGLKYYLNADTNENYKQNFLDANDTTQTINNYRGEGNPILKDFSNETKTIYTEEYLESQKFKYLSPYINYSFTELGFKLSALIYYYQTYFLPIYTVIKGYSLEYKVYANKIKHIAYSYDHYFENIVNVHNDLEIIFPKTNTLYFTHQYHVVDEHYNEFISYDNRTETFIINDTCLYVPIIFENNKYYNCIFILKDNELNKIIYKTTFKFLNSQNELYKGWVFYPKLLNNSNLYTFINKNYTIYINVNNKWFSYTFNAKISEFDIHIGKLNYKYYINDINYLHDYQKENLSNIIFRFNDTDDELDITEFIKVYDFFDMPLKYMSNFSQIKYIDENNQSIEFNSYMNNQNLITLNDINFGLLARNEEKTKYVNVSYENICEDNIRTLINSHRDKIDIFDNDDYLNMVHLYEAYEVKSIDGKNILKFKKDLNVLCKDVVFTNYNNDFTIRRLFNYETSISTYDDVNHYLLDNNEPTLDEDGNAWYFIIGKQNNSYASCQDLYEYKEDKSSEKEIGYIIYVLNNDNSINISNVDDIIYKVINDEYDFNNLIIKKNNHFEYLDKLNNKSYNVYFRITYLIDLNENISNEFKFEEYDNNNIEHNNKTIYIKLNLFHYEITKQLNIFGYYNTNFIYNDVRFCENFKQGNNKNTAKCTVNIPYNDTYITVNNVVLRKTKEYSSYKDIATNYNITDDNQSFYWCTYSTIDGTIFDGKDLLNNNDQYDLSYKYLNYLCKDLTGISGEYKVKINVKAGISKLNTNINLNNYFKICILKNNEEHDIETSYKNGIFESDIITLTGEEQSVLLYFKVNLNDQISYLTLNPEFVKIEKHIIPLQYNKNDTYNLYSELFYEKYTIYSKLDDKLTPIHHIYESNVNICNNSMFDTYLMHDNTNWYFMFISKEPCSHYTIYDLKNYKENLSFKIGDKEIYLKHSINKKLFLINRMTINYQENIYHFNKNDFVVASLYNNDMLPHDVLYSSKWTITPITYGSKTTQKIYSNNNSCIFYGKDTGYYEMLITYSLDKNTSNIKKIKKKIFIQ